MIRLIPRRLRSACLVPCVSRATWQASALGLRPANRCLVVTASRFSAHAPPLGASRWAPPRAPCPSTTPGLALPSSPSSWAPSSASVPSTSPPPPTLSSAAPSLQLTCLTSLRNDDPRLSPGYPGPTRGATEEAPRSRHLSLNAQGWNFCGFPCIEKTEPHRPTKSPLQKRRPQRPPVKQPAGALCRHQGRPQPQWAFPESALRLQCRL